jgi:hypothetical protein
VVLADLAGAEVAHLNLNNSTAVGNDEPVLGLHVQLE